MSDRNGYIRTIYGTHTHTDDDDGNDDDDNNDNDDDDDDNNDDNDTLIFYSIDNDMPTFCYCVSLSCFVWIYNLTVMIISQKYRELSMQVENRE